MGSGRVFKRVRDHVFAGRNDPAEGEVDWGGETISGALAFFFFFF